MTTVINVPKELLLILKKYIIYLMKNKEASLFTAIK